MSGLLEHLAKNHPALRCPHGVSVVGRNISLPASMVEPRYLVPAMVELFPLNNGQSRLSILWTYGQRGKLHRPAAAVRTAQTVLLQPMTEQAMINVAHWPGMKVGSAMSTIGSSEYNG